MKKPANTRRGRRTGTTNAAAASGVGKDSPITAPSQERETFNSSIFPSVLFHLPAESETILHRIRIPIKMKYLRTLSYRLVIQ
jgi:hypothetical protein